MVQSFLDWVEALGGSPPQAFSAPAKSREVNFKSLYKSVRNLRQFGWTGTFDLLCSLGDLGILNVRPDSCYLSGATGPLKGARRLWGKTLPNELTRLADEAARTLGVPIAMIEDALCSYGKVIP